MKFALLGADSESLCLAAAALAAGHEIVWLGDLGGAVPPGDAAPGGDQADAWEDLVDEDAADAIILGRGAASRDLRAQQLQQFVRLGRPVLATHPIVSSVLSYFEVDMGRTEGGALLQHFNPLTCHPIVNDVAQWAAGGHPTWGRIEQIVCTRSIADRSRDRVLFHFARDVELLGQVAGWLNRIGAHAGESRNAADYSGLSVQLLGTLAAPVRWTVEPPAEHEGMTLHLICQLGRVSLAFNAADNFVEQLGSDSTSSGAALPAPADPAVIAIQRFVAAVESADAAASTWSSALHAMELADSIEISLRRGRMIDVYDQQLTEQLAFKGTMSALGCGVLMVIVPLMLLVGWIAGLLGVPLAEYWPHALLALLAIFLAFQLLPTLLYRDSPHPQRGPGDRRSERNVKSDGGSSRGG